MIGLAVGDALGAPIEFGYTSTMIREKMDIVRHFHDNIMPPKGVWTDDTSMALCLADSLLEKRGYDSYDIMDKFAAWEFSGYRSYYSMGYGVGMQTDIAITAYTENPILKKDEPETESIANGCIMRLAPVVIANIENTKKECYQVGKIIVSRNPQLDWCYGDYGTNGRNVISDIKRRAERLLTGKSQKYDKR